jgi:hypothetical protein
VGEQRLVAAVDTVEIANCQSAGRPAFGIRKTAEDSHDNGWGEAAECRKAKDYKRLGQAAACPPGLAFAEW